MSKKANPTLVGMFVLGAVALGIVSLLTFGSSEFLKEKKPIYRVYFEGSLGGLDVGAPVHFKGVQIGQVKAISLIYNSKTDSIHLPVLFEVDRTRFKEDSEMMDEVTPGEMMQRHIDRGLRARLETLNLLTGKLKIDLGYFPENEAQFHGSADTEYMEVPSIPTTLEVLTQTVMNLPLTEMVKELRGAIAGLEKLVTNDQWVNMAAGVEETLKTVNEAVVALNKNLPEMSKNATGIMANVASVTEELGRTLVQAQGLMEGMGQEVDPVRHQLGMALAEIGQAARSLRLLTEQLEQQPQSLVFGKSQEK